MASPDAGNSTERVKRPLVVAGQRDVYDTPVREQPAFYAPDVAQDATFIPGYSDKRRQVDEARKNGTRPPALTHRYHLVRTKMPSGRPDMRDAFNFRAKGYREVHTDELASLGIQMPLGGIKNTDGTISVGDTTLFVCSAEQAARNEENWRRATDDRSAVDTSAAPLHEQGAAFARPGERLTFTEHQAVTDNKVAP